MEQPVDRVSHVVYCLREENLERAADFLTKVLGAEFEEVHRPELGLRIFISLRNGLELIAPSSVVGTPAERFTTFLAERGEGLYNIVYGVRDLDPPIERARELGVAVTHRGSFAHVEPWIGRFDAIDEAHLEPFCGMHITLGQIEPRN